MSDFAVVAYLMNREVTQAEFAALVGVSEARVSQLLDDGTLARGQTAHQWLVGYVERLRDQAAGRDPNGELASARTDLARQQALGQRLKNATTQGEFASIGLLADVLGMASAALGERLEALPSRIKIACPELSDSAREILETTIAAARNEWVRATSDLVEAKLAALTEAEDEAAEGLATP